MKKSPKRKPSVMSATKVLGRVFDNANVDPECSITPSEESRDFSEDKSPRKVSMLFACFLEPPLTIDRAISKRCRILYRVAPSDLVVLKTVLSSVILKPNRRREMLLIIPQLGIWLLILPGP
jgi:hypothetical protein